MPYFSLVKTQLCVPAAIVKMAGLFAQGHISAIFAPPDSSGDALKRVFPQYAL
jgi:hypothetical protein